MRICMIFLLLISATISQSQEIILPETTKTQEIKKTQGAYIAATDPRKPLSPSDNLAICEQSCRFRRGMKVFSCVGDTIAQDKRYVCECVE